MLTIDNPSEINNKKKTATLTSVELCAGAGGQALGLEQAGFFHLALVENDAPACQTLRANRKKWNVLELDIKKFNATSYKGIDLLAGGIPCPPFSIAGKQLGSKDERNLFSEVIRITKECAPKAIMIENVKGLLAPKFNEYRQEIARSFERLGYFGEWRLLNASDFGVPQLRPRVVFVALKQPYKDYFKWPKTKGKNSPSVGKALYKMMSSNGWEKAKDWQKKANKIAPTLVGGSKKHGGPDLGPTRAKRAWAELNVDGNGLANLPPERGFKGMPKLTVNMCAILQGFPEDWQITGKKTPAYRQVGNAFPPPVAKAIGKAIADALQKKEK